MKHLLKLITLLIGVSVISFLLISASPIDPVQANVGEIGYLNMSPERRAQLAAHWGADTPVFQRYFDWASSFIQGDMGHSLRYNQPVSEVIWQRFQNSALLLVTAWVLSGVLGFVLGVIAGANRGSVLDRAIKGFSLVLASTPTFWFGLLVLMIFAVRLGWIPFGFSAPIGTSMQDVGVSDLLKHLIGPAITLSIVGIANITLHTREKLIDVMDSEYFLFARARGETIWTAVRRHGIRNILLPAITLQFASMAEIFGGSVLVEQVFSYPGLGQATVTAGLGGDAALLAGIAVITAAIVFIGNSIANVAYRVIDPRMRRSDAVN